MLNTLSIQTVHGVTYPVVGQAAVEDQAEVPPPKTSREKTSTSQTNVYRKGST